MVLCCWHPWPNSILLPGSSLPPVFLAIHKRSTFLRYCRCSSPGQWTQLLFMGCGRLHLQLLYPSFPLPMVDAIQLHSLRSTGCRRRFEHHHRLLRCAVSQGRVRSEVVGQYGYELCLGIRVSWAKTWITVWMNTADALGTPLYVTKPGETFGPTTWS